MKQLVKAAIKTVVMIDSKGLSLFLSLSHTRAHSHGHGLSRQRAISTNFILNAYIIFS